MPRERSLENFSASSSSSAAVSFGEVKVIPGYVLMWSDVTSILANGQWDVG